MICTEQKSTIINIIIQVNKNWKEIWDLHKGVETRPM